MLHNKLKQLLLGGAAATTLLLSPYAAQAGGIVVYTAANFTGTAKILLDRFIGGGITTYTIASGATGDLVTAILAGGNYSTMTTTGGTVFTYPQADLFFADNMTAVVTSLSTVWGTIVQPSGFDGTTTVTHYAWAYAQGFLELLSNGAGAVNTSGLDQITSGNYPFSPALVIAKPSTDAYGHAALQVINAEFSGAFTDGFAFPTGSGRTQTIVTASDTGLAYNSVAAVTYYWGFVDRSRIATYDPDTYVMSYSSTIAPATAHYAYQSGMDYDPILQGAAKINGPGDHTFRDAFVRWLASPDAASIIMKHGFAIPYPAFFN